MTSPRPQIANAGEISRERVIIRAEDDMDLGLFALFCCHAGSSHEKFKSGDIPHVYWFGSDQIKKGDFVVLYTKAGIYSEKVTAEGVTSHFHYWGKQEALWSTANRAILVETHTWKAAQVQPILEE